MTKGEKFNFVRKWIIILNLTFASAGFYSFLISGLVGHLFHLDETNALIYVGIPLFCIFEYIFLKKAPKVLEKAGWI